METKLWAEICEVDMGGRSVRGLGVLASKVGGSIMFGLGVGELGIWAGNGRLGWIKKSEVVDCARSGVIGPRCWGFEARSFGLVGGEEFGLSLGSVTKYGLFWETGSICECGEGGLS